MADTTLDPPGLAPSLRGGLCVALLAGLAFGLIDGLIAAWRGPDLALVELLGCLCVTVVLYCALYAVLGMALGGVVYGAARGLAFGRRQRLVLGLLLAAGVFLEVYWWSRPFVFYGVPATSAPRLVAAGVMALGSLAAGQSLAALVARLPEVALRRIRDLLMVCAVGAMAMVVLAWRAGGGSARGEINERNADMPNVLLFVVDALRQDTLEPYGHPRVRTPSVMRLAEAGVVFDNAFVQAPYTWTSFGSILTGKYPRRHGLVLMAPSQRMMLDQNLTLAWHLKQAGLTSGGALQDGDFAGAAFMTGTLSQGSGLMHGFDWYFEAMAGHELVSLDSAWSVFRARLLVSRVKNKLTQRFDNSLVTSTAVDWLRVHAGRRFVGMVHLYSTHTPYDPERSFREAYVDPDYAGPIQAFYAESRQAIEAGEYEPTPADVDQIRNLYLAGVAQADRDVGLVLDELERQGVLDDTLVIFTSDHGEELSEHGLWEHNWMYQTNLRIPLILSWPGGLEGGRRVGATVETIDLLPTVCELLGIALPELEGEYGRLDGRSLVPLMRGEVEGVRTYSFAENGRYVSIQDPSWKLIVEAEALTREDGFERALAGDAPRPRLYHLAADPGETRNLFDEEPSEARRLFVDLRAWDATMPIPRAQIVPSDRDLEHRLHGLGYTGDEGTGNRSVLEEEGGDR